MKSNIPLLMEAKNTTTLDETERQYVSVRDRSSPATDGGDEEASCWSGRDGCALTMNNNNNVDYCGEEPSTSSSMSDRSMNAECETQSRVVDEDDWDSSSLSSEEVFNFKVNC